jgi:hypothetical protein
MSLEDEIGQHEEVGLADLLGVFCNEREPPVAEDQKGPQRALQMEEVVEKDRLGMGKAGGIEG